MRIFDIALALLFLLLSLPLLILISAWIACTSKGSVFFFQTRIGLGGRSFAIWKFRTMRADSPYLGNTTTQDDVRLIRGGKLLRKFKVDELPQLVNILKGDMAFVGPRPTVREDYERMDMRQRKRYAARPGLTGLAQISGNTSLSWPQRIELDLKYLETRNPLMDLKIIVITAIQILTGRADTHPTSADEWQES